MEITPDKLNDLMVLMDCDNGDHKWGEWEIARFTGNPYRPCTEPGCNTITLDGDGCDCGDRECPECAEWYAANGY